MSHSHHCAAAASVLLLLATACAQNASTPLPATDADAIRAASRAYVRAAADTAWTAWGNMFTADAEGFRFALNSSGLVRLVDTLGQSLFAPRPDFVTGLVTVSPGHAPQWIPRLPSTRELKGILQDYVAGRVRLFIQPARARAA